MVFGLVQWIVSFVIFCTVIVIISWSAIHLGKKELSEQENTKISTHKRETKINDSWRDVRDTDCSKLLRKLGVNFTVNHDHVTNRSTRWSLDNVNAVEGRENFTTRRSFDLTTLGTTTRVLERNPLTEMITEPNKRRNTLKPLSSKDTTTGSSKPTNVKETDITTINIKTVTSRIRRINWNEVKTKVTSNQIKTTRPSTRQKVTSLRPPEDNNETLGFFTTPYDLRFSPTIIRV